ncbi:MAG: hypothetical protein JXR96_21205 [Deltaproteobacteria bacterium]|nr:hypothetical protein [Deltaproteobacteria bacterium]
MRSAWIGSLLGLLAWPCAAHEGYHLRSHRCLLKPDGLHYAIQYLLPAGDEARLSRRRLDANADGHLDSGERDAGLDAIQRELLSGLRVELDGVELKPRVLRRESTGLEGPAERSDFISASVQLVFDLDGGRAGQVRRLVLRDQPVPAAAHIPVWIQAGKGVEIVEITATRVRSPRSARARPAMWAGVLHAGARIELRYRSQAP